MKTETENIFWKFEPAYWFQQLDSAETGLSHTVAQQVLSEQKLRMPQTHSEVTKALMLFANQFKSPLMLLLIGAVVLSGFLGDTSDVFIILFIVLSTGLLSFFQERNAGKVVEKLQSLISIKAAVLRDGSVQELKAEQVVPGDMILLKAGDMLPADCLIIESNELHVNESSLTGESYPARKEAGLVEETTELSKRINCLWEGTNIVSGTAKALVIQTGENTLFGNLAKSASKTVETAFEKGIKDFGFFLMKITLVLAVFILVVNLLNHKSVIESALFALALAVGMAPELLPAITTIAMSAGAKKLLEKKVIVKKLNSIQNLGEVNLLCTDKTGTITEGIVSISSITDGFGVESASVKQLAYWNAFFETGYANPIDLALRQLKIDQEIPATKIGEIPYDFIRKRLSIAVTTNEGNSLICKGAFAQILGICTRVQGPGGDIVAIDAYRQEIEERFAQFGKNGLRAIAICYKNFQAEPITKELESEMIFAGFILMDDPVKADITDTIHALNQLQVGLKIITGDNKNVATAIALKIGIEEPVIMTGRELLDTNSEALEKRVRATHIFAEVEPQQKERVIMALKKSYTVAYMGDGINDVSAINAADVGISVNNAVDVAREAADFVLMEKELMVIVEGIKQGRRTFSNTMKYLYINTGATFGNMFSVAAASLLLPFLPMLPKQILLTNFLTDFPYLSVSNDNVDSEVLEKPGKWDLKLIRNYMFYFGIHSSVFDIITFSTLYFLLKTNESAFQSGWFIESILTEIFILFIIRTQHSFVKSKPGKYLFILSILALVLTIGLPYLPFAADFGLVPLPMVNLGAMLLIVLGYVLTADMLKIWFFRKYQSA